MGRARRVGDRARGEVAGGPDHERALAAGVAQGVEDVGDLAARDARVELEREVDDLRPAASGVADARADRDAVAGAGTVEHAHGHDPRPVGEAGDAEAVARRLGDRARHVRAMAVEIVGVGVAVDEVAALEEAVEQVGRAAIAAPRRIRDAGVEHGDLDPEAARPADRVQVVPGVRRVDPEVLAEVPLHGLPGAGGAAGLARVVGGEAAHVRDQVRARAEDAGPALELGDRLRDALAVADLQHARARGEDVRLTGAGRALRGGAHPAAGARRVADDHLVRDVHRPGVHVGRRTGGVRAGRKHEHAGHEAGEHGEHGEEAERGGDGQAQGT